MATVLKERPRAESAIAIGRDTLAALVSRTRGAVLRRSTIPILNNTKHEASGGYLRVTANNLDLEITNSAECDGEFGTTVNGEQLDGLLAKMPAGADCSLEMDGGRLLLSCGRSTYRLPALPTSDFPLFDAHGLGEPVAMDTDTLAELIAKAAFAMSREATRTYLYGLHLHPPTPGQIRAVATDSHVLAAADANAPLGYAGPALTIPSAAVRELSRLLDSAGESVMLRLSSRLFQVSGGPWVFTSKVIDGDFPSYERVIPAENPRTARVDRKLLADGVGRLQVLAEYRAVKLEFTEGHLRATVRGTDGCEGVEEIEADFEGSALSVGVNSGLLLGVLERIEDASVELRLPEASRADGLVIETPALILDPSNERVRFVLMPLRA